MKKNAFFLNCFIFFLILIPAKKGYGLSFIDLSTKMSSVFSSFASDAEGTTSYRSLLIPIGGRAESLGNAFTGLCDDASYINYNPGASCILKQTQGGLFHNAWIADSKMESLCYSTRFGNLGIGAQLNCFYVPFSEYNIMGQRVASNYYSETTAAVNVSYNFLAGYEFKGFALGFTFKTCFRGVPDYTDNDTNAIKKHSGIGQSGIAFMGDLGVVLQFNFLKYFASRDPNVRIGFTAQNLGVGITGLGTAGGIRLDDPLPTSLCAGISVKFFPFLTACVDIKQPVNLMNLSNYQLFSLSIGADFSFADYFSILAGLELKGGNPRLSLGAEFEYNNTRINLNYTLDLTSSGNPVNRISLSAKLLLGDKGRAETQKKIDALYNEGLVYYYSSEWEKAIETWEKILEIDKRYDPAIIGIESAKAQMNMIQKVRDTMFFEE